MSKLRTDSWAAALSEDQQWQLYYKSRALRWNEAAVWAVKEFGLDRPPSRTGFYEWLGHMREEESSHRLSQAATAAAEAAALAKTQARDDALIGAYKAMAAELALRTGSAKEAQRFVEMAMSLRDRDQKERELALKAAAQSTKDEQLKLAREKFEEEAARRTAAEARAEKAEAEAEALKATIKELEKALQDAGKVNVADPARVAAEVDRILGRKPQQ